MTKKPANKKQPGRQAAASLRRLKKVEDFIDLAWASMWTLKHRDALNWALKALALEPGHEGARLMALRCARLLQDEDTIFLILGEMYRDGTLLDRKDFYLLGRLALFQQDYRWAEEIFQTFLDDAAAKKPRLKGRLSQARLREAQQSLLFAQLMLEKNPTPRAPAGPPPSPSVAAVKPAPKTKPSKAVKAATVATVAEAEASPAETQVAGPSRKKKPRGQSQTIPTRKGKQEAASQAKPKQRAAQPSSEKKAAAGEKAKIHPGPAAETQVHPQAASPPEPPPELKVVFDLDPAPVLQAVSGRRQSDPAGVQLALKAPRASGQNRRAEPGDGPENRRPGAEISGARAGFRLRRPAFTGGRGAPAAGTQVSPVVPLPQGHLESLAPKPGPPGMRKLPPNHTPRPPDAPGRRREIALPAL